MFKAAGMIELYIGYLFEYMKQCKLQWGGSGHEIYYAKKIIEVTSKVFLNVACGAKATSTKIL